MLKVGVTSHEKWGGHGLPWPPGCDAYEIGAWKFLKGPRIQLKYTRPLQELESGDETITVHAWSRKGLQVIYSIVCQRGLGAVSVAVAVLLQYNGNVHGVYAGRELYMWNNYTSSL